MAIDSAHEAVRVFVRIRPRSDGASAQDFGGPSRSSRSPLKIGSDWDASLPQWARLKYIDEPISFRTARPQKEEQPLWAELQEGTSEAGSSASHARRDKPPSRPRGADGDAAASSVSQDGFSVSSSESGLGKVAPSPLPIAEKVGWGVYREQPTPASPSRVDGVGKLPNGTAVQKKLLNAATTRRRSGE